MNKNLIKKMNEKKFTKKYVMNYRKEEGKIAYYLFLDVRVIDATDSVELSLVFAHFGELSLVFLNQLLEVSDGVLR